jgi:hypothetical protein
MIGCTWNSRNALRKIVAPTSAFNALLSALPETGRVGMRRLGGRGGQTVQLALHGRL